MPDPVSHTRDRRKFSYHHFYWDFQLYDGNNPPECRNYAWLWKCSFGNESYDDNIRKQTFSLKEIDKFFFNKSSVNLHFCYKITERSANGVRTFTFTSFKIENISIIPSKKANVNIYFTLNGTTMSNVEYKILYE